MILEKIEKQGLALQGFAGIRSVKSTDSLKKLRQRYPQCQIQLFRADRIAGKEHLIFAAMAAIRAFSQHRERSHKLAVELMLYTSCQRQISKAIQLLGVIPQTHDLVLAALAGRDVDLRSLVQSASIALDGKPDDSVVEIRSVKKMMELMRTYGISKTEIGVAKLLAEEQEMVLKRLIIERSALLAVEK